MKRFVLGILLFASASLLCAADMTIIIQGDARGAFQRLWAADQVKEGLNLVETAGGRKLWANVKGGGGFATYDWVFTDMSGRTLASSLIRIQTMPTGGTPRSEERCLECVENPNGTRTCHEVPCPVRVPCCSNHHWCCIK